MASTSIYMVLIRASSDIGYTMPLVPIIEIPPLNTNIRIVSFFCQFSHLLEHKLLHYIHLKKFPLFLFQSSALEQDLWQPPRFFQIIPSALFYLCLCHHLYELIYPLSFHFSINFHTISGIWVISSIFYYGTRGEILFYFRIIHL